jgi:hypothetical protein
VELLEEPTSRVPLGCGPRRDDHEVAVPGLELLQAEQDLLAVSG